MRNAILTAALILTALGARAEVMPQMLGNDPLSRQILAKTAQENGGVTAAVRVGTGQAIELKITEPSAAPAAAKLAPPAKDTDLYLKPAADLAAKPVKAKARKPVHRAIEQLKRDAAEKR
jgi:hypothetical protein